MTVDTPTLCYHLQTDDSLPYVGIVDRHGLAFTCTACTVDKFRSLLSGQTPEQITEDVYLEHADARGIITELLKQVDDLKSGALPAPKAHSLSPSKFILWKTRP